VARDPEESGFGTSVFSKSKGARRNSEAPSCDGSHGDGAEDSTWHRTSRSGFWKVSKSPPFICRFPDREIPDTQKC
jgi:hypothetical protein